MCNNMQQMINWLNQKGNKQYINNIFIVQIKATKVKKKLTL